MAWARQRSNGDWTGYYRDPNGKTRSAGTESKEKVALKLAQDEESKIRLGRWQDPDAGSMTLVDYYEKHWLPNRRMGDNYEDTVRSNWRTEINPTFGHLQLRNIHRSTVQGWIVDMERRGVYANTVNAKFKTLQTILAARKGASALRDNFLPQGNPCAGTDLPAMVTRDVTIYTPDQIDKIAACLDPWYQMIINFAVDSGCRWGELQGLQVNDVNFLTRRVVVQRTIVETSLAKAGNGTRFKVKDGTKNGDATRKFGVTQEIIDGLAAHCQRLGLKGDDRMFPAHNELRRHKQRPATVTRTDVWPNGLPISRSHFANVWLDAQLRSGVPILRVHDLRASSISWLLSDSKTNQVLVMERVGHKEWSTTARYASTLPDADDVAAGALERVRARFRDA